MRTSSNLESHVTSLIQLVPAAALLVLMACAGLGSAAYAAEPGSGLQVTVLVYSGRPNPTFAIEDEAGVLDLHEALSAAEPYADFQRETVVPSILGYHGLRLETRSDAEGLPKVILIYDGAIELRNGEKRFLADPGRRLERKLIEQAIERDLLDETTLRAIRQELGGKPDNVP